MWTRIAIEITENQGETWLQLDQKLAPDEMFLSRPGVERWIEFQTANYQNLAALTRDRIKESQKTKVTGVRFVEYEQSVTGDIGNVRIVYEKVWTD